MMISRRHALALLSAAPAIAAAGPVAARAPEIFQAEGAAIHGVDPVAYFTDGRPVNGDAAHAVMYNDATWHFVSAENAQRFAQDPDKYGAQFGGYCAFAASRGYLAPTQPDAWTIHEDRLYLNANLRARELWLKDVPGNIAKGQANWPSILG